MSHFCDTGDRLPIAGLRVGMDGKRGSIEFCLGRRFVVEMVEAIRAPRQGRAILAMMDSHVHRDDGNNLNG